MHILPNPRHSVGLLPYALRPFPVRNLPAKPAYAQKKLEQYRSGRRRCPGLDCGSRRPVASLPGHNQQLALRINGRCRFLAPPGQDAGLELAGPRSHSHGPHRSQDPVCGGMERRQSRRRCVDQPRRRPQLERARRLERSVGLLLHAGALRSAHAFRWNAAGGLPQQRRWKHLAPDQSAR